MRPLRQQRITIRFTDDEYFRYLRAAAEVGLTPSEYLRLRLKSTDESSVADQIAQLRFTVLDNLGPTEDQHDSVMLLETLLLLRHVCRPGDVRSVHGELQRLGHAPWSAQASPPSGTKQD